MIEKPPAGCRSVLQNARTRPYSPFFGGGELFDLNDMVAEARAEVGDLSDELDTPPPLPDLSHPPCLVSRKSEHEICPAQSGGRLHFSAILLAPTAGGINNVARTNACPFYSWPSRLL
jgi:hypothetical protein